MDIKKIAELKNLTVPEKILLIEDICDSILDEEKKVPVPDSHKVELDKRFKEYDKGPGKLLTLDDLQEKINKRK